MIYTIGGIIAAITGLIAFIYGLIQKNQALKDTVVKQTAQSEIQKIEAVLKDKDVSITEEERDYEQSKKDFDAKYGSGNSGNGGSAS